MTRDRTMLIIEGRWRRRRKEKRWKNEKQKICHEERKAGRKRRKLLLSKRTEKRNQNVTKSLMDGWMDERIKVTCSKSSNSNSM